MPNRSLPSLSRNSEGPKPKVIVSPLGDRPMASPVSSGGRLDGAVDRPDRPGVGAAGHPLGGLGPLLEQVDELVAVVVVTSNAAKCSRSWAGVTIPAWCSPWKSYWSGRRGLRRRALAGAADRERAGHPGGGCAAAEQSASRDLHRCHGYESTAAVRRESGSDSALTASESALTSSGGQLVVDLKPSPTRVASSSACSSVEAGLELGRRARRPSGRRSASRPRSRRGRRRRWPGSPRGRSATSTPPRR